MQESGQDRAGVRAVERALDILTTLGGQPQPLSGADVAARMKLHPATAHRLLGTLVNLGWVEQDPESARYRLGNNLIAVGATGLVRSPLMQHGREFLRRAAEVSGYSAYLGVLVGARVVYLARSLGAHGMPTYEFEPGTSRPAHAQAAGKVLLAYLLPAERDFVLAGSEMLPFTPDTIVEREHLEAELEAVRRQAWATDRGERFDFMHGGAVPVHGPDGRVVASLMCYGRMNLTPEFEAMLKQELTMLAGELSSRLGRVD